MFCIIVNGDIIDTCDDVRYVKMNKDSGSYIRCFAEEAEGISVRGDLYNINDNDIIPDRPMAVISEKDASEIVFNQSVKIKENANGIADVESAVCELDSTTDTKISEIELALCEIDMIMNE